MKCVKEFHFTKYLKEIMCKHHLNHNKHESLMHLIDFFLLSFQAPLIIQRVEQFAFMIEEKWKWKEWKYLFKLTSSKMVSRKDVY